MCGFTLPCMYSASSSSLLRRFFSGSFRVKAPQNTPTIAQPFSSARLSGTFGISPAAKPTTRKRPFHAMSRSAISEYGPPTGSYTTSTPLPDVSAFTRARRSSLA
jgi:hypothetical protein